VKCPFYFVYIAYLSHINKPLSRPNLEKVAWLAIDEPRAYK